jgi:hypothetical protein
MTEVTCSSCPTVCCGDKRGLRKANTTDGAAEKHVPADCAASGKRALISIRHILPGMCFSSEIRINKEISLFCFSYLYRCATICEVKLKERKVE